MPEFVEEGVVIPKKDDDIVNMLLKENDRAKGNWIKVNNMEEVNKLDSEKKLKGFDPKKMEVLI